MRHPPITPRPSLNVLIGSTSFVCLAEFCKLVPRSLAPTDVPLATAASTCNPENSSPIMRLLYLLLLFLVCLIQATSGKLKVKNIECEKMGGVCKHQRTHGCSILPAECRSRKKHCCRV
uniref:Beta-defensin 33-like n=2 Tax=Camelus TaxID=9836 RepID=A0A9W3HGT5_CAMBA|nr:beta-defensin 33-like [Camelus bactrianus]